MAYFERKTVSIATLVTSSGIGYSDGVANGYVHSIAYNPTTTLGPNFPAGYVATFIAEVSGAVIATLNSPATSGWAIYPRTAVCTSSGGSLYWGTSSGGNLAAERVPLVNERIQAIVTVAGSSHFGDFYVYVGG